MEGDRLIELGKELQKDIIALKQRKNSNGMDSIVSVIMERICSLTERIEQLEKTNE